MGLDDYLEPQQPDDDFETRTAFKGLAVGDASQRIASDSLAALQREEEQEEEEPRLKYGRLGGDTPELLRGARTIEFLL